MSTATLTNVPVIPDSAPFTAAQRAWLNGFFAGLFGGQVASGSSASPAVAETEVQEDEAMPWHDPALSMDERLKLAEGKPKERVLMSAMAQLDCGACGYLCQTYAEAIAHGEEKDMTRCAPGGKDTAKKLKELMADQAASKMVAPSQVRIKRSESSKSPNVFDRNNPFPARLLANRLLNKPGSAKDTRFISLDLKGSGLSYNVGDSLGLYPENCPETINWLLDRLNASGAEEVPGLDGLPVTLFEALQRHYQITMPSEPLVELLARTCDGHMHAEVLSAMLDDNGPGIPDGHEIIDLLTMFPTARPSIGDFVAALRPLQPRLYSIASSLKAQPDEVHLTVGVVRYVNAKQRQCKGVASTFLADRLRPGQKARVFIQPSHGFHLPYDHSARLSWSAPALGLRRSARFFRSAKQSTLRERTGFSSATNAPNLIFSIGKNWKAIPGTELSSTSTPHFPETKVKRFMCKRACSIAQAKSGVGFSKEHISTSVAMPSGWRWMWMLPFAKSSRRKAA